MTLLSADSVVLALIYGIQSRIRTRATRGRRHADIAIARDRPGL